MSKIQEAIDNVKQAKAMMLAGDIGYSHQKIFDWICNALALLEAGEKADAQQGAAMSKTPGMIRNVSHEMTNFCETLLQIMEPISMDCMCLDPPCDDHEEPLRRDPEDPSCHAQYCPMYITAYIEAQRDGTPYPE